MKPETITLVIPPELVAFMGASTIIFWIITIVLFIKYISPEILRIYHKLRVRKVYIDNRELFVLLDEKVTSLRDDILKHTGFINSLQNEVSKGATVSKSLQLEISNLTTLVNSTKSELVIAKKSYQEMAVNKGQTVLELTNSIDVLQKKLADIEKKLADYVKPVEILTPIKIDQIDFSDFVKPPSEEFITAIKMFEYAIKNFDGLCGLEKLKPVFRKDDVTKILRDFEVKLYENKKPYPIIGVLNEDYVLIPPNGRTGRILVKLSDYLAMNGITHE